MADKIYTKAEIEAIKEGLNHYFPFELGLETQKIFVNDKWGDSYGFFKWNGRNDFFSTLSSATKIKNFSQIKLASSTLEGMEAAAPEAPEYKGAEPSPVSKTTLTSEESKQLIEEAEAAKAKREKIVAEQKETVEKGIKKQQEIHNSIKAQQELYAQQKAAAEKLKAALEKNGSKIYVKVETPEVEEADEIEALKEQAQANPQKFVEDAAKNAEARISASGISKQESNIAAKQIGLTTYKTLTSDSPLTGAAIASQLAANPEALEKLIPDAAQRQYFIDILQVHADQKFNQFELAKAFYDFQKIDGVSGVNDLKIQFSMVPREGFRELNLNKEFIEPHIESISESNSLMTSIKDFGADKIQSKFLSFAGEKLSLQISKLPAESAVSRLYNSEIVQFGLSKIGLVSAAPWVAVEGSFFGRIMIGSGFGPLAGFIQKTTGLDLGVKIASKAAGEIGKKAVVQAGAKAAEAAGAKVAGGLISKVGALLGSVGGFVGMALTFIGGWILEKIIKKIPWKKIGPWLAGGAAFLIAGPAAGLAALGLTFGLLSGLNPFTRLIRRFFTPLPVLILEGFLKFLAGFAILAAIITLILLVINSGAYVVPPGISTISSINAYIEVEKKADPAGSQPNPTPKTTITYNVKITAKKDNLTRISFTSKCEGIKKGGVKIPCPTETLPAPPAEIVAGQSFTFSFKSVYDSAFADSLVTDSVNVSAFSNSGGKVNASGTASICFGNCPLDCFNFPDKYWPKNITDVQNLKSLLEGAVGKLVGDYPNFTAKACSGGTINLCYNPSAISGDIFALHKLIDGCNISFNMKVAGYGAEGTLFLLTHEATHHIQDIAGQYYQKFTDQVSPAEPDVCSYGGTNQYESMAEGAALYVARPIIDKYGGCITNFSAQYPKHYNFDKNVLFAP